MRDSPRETFSPMTKRLKPPAQLSKDAAAWWASVVGEWDLDPHHLHLLTAAAEQLDVRQQAQEAMARDGAVVLDRFGQPKPHPGAAIQRDAALTFARLVRELGLDIPASEAPRPPRLR